MTNYTETVPKWQHRKDMKKNTQSSISIFSIKNRFQKSYPKDRINGVTQERYKRIKFRNKEKYFFKKIVF